MLKFIKINAGICIVITIIFWNCGNQPTEPNERKINFKFDIEYGKIPEPALFARKLFNKSGETDATLNKKLSIQQYSLARVMAIDLSKYESWSDFTNTEDWTDYVTARDAWTGNRDSWAEWKGFIGDFFPIVTDQNLVIEEDHATGTISGVLGLNRFLVGLTEGDLIRYLGEGEAYGVEGETQQVKIYVTKWGVW